MQSLIITLIKITGETKEGMKKKIKAGPKYGMSQVKTPGRNWTHAQPAANHELPMVA